MSDQGGIGLDNAVFSGRLRQPVVETPVIVADAPRSLDAVMTNTAIPVVRPNGERRSYNTGMDMPVASAPRVNAFRPSARPVTPLPEQPTTAKSLEIAEAAMAKVAAATNTVAPVVSELKEVSKPAAAEAIVPAGLSYEHLHSEPKPRRQLIKKRMHVAKSKVARVVKVKLTADDELPNLREAGKIVHDYSVIKTKRIGRGTARATKSVAGFKNGKFIYSKTQVGLMSMAAAMFAFGILVSVQTLHTNHDAALQVAQINKKVDSGSSTTDNQSVADGGTQAASSTTPPSTTHPSQAAVASYAVAPDLAKYIIIPKLGVDSRVLQVGVGSDGALGTPSNVFDTAWYTGSAKPGQPGATLIDGHVSSWTAHGVFYGIKTLMAGDTIQIVKGDNSVVNYQVVKTQVYDHNNVDMQAAITPIDSTTSGLNLITCTGQVINGTNEFNERVLVFAKEVQ